MTTADWYLVQTKANSHLIAERHLLRQSFEVFLPMTEVTQRRGARFVTQTGPLFPGYLFARDTPASAPASAIGNTVGVLRRVTVAGKPALIPDSLVDAIRTGCTEAEVSGGPEEDLPAGSHVQIAHGPFAAFVAQVERTHPDGRVAVLLEVAGQHHRLRVDRAQLGPRTD
ncbi:MAG: transcriptional activator RfaH [Pseudomonadota bacterium]|nr:transcriptional activator RfaH [Pseudomonadota bacterium]